MESMGFSMMTQKRIQLTYSQQLVTVTIAAGKHTSGQIDIRDAVAMGLTVGVPSSWTDAAIGVEVSEDGGENGTWEPVRDETGAKIQITGVQTAERGVYIWDRDLWAIKNYPFVRLVSINSDTGAAVNQVAARTLRVGILN